MAEPPSITTKSGKQGFDLNEVVREILRQLMTDRTWSEARAAREWGFTQRTLNRFMNRETGMDLDTLSRLCAELEVNPPAFFSAHPIYDHEARARLRFVKDRLYDRFRTLLNVDEAKRVLANVEEQKRLHIFDLCSETIDGLLRVAREARRYGIAEAKKAVGTDG